MNSRPVLFRPTAFEPLTDVAWSEQRVRSAIREIVADATWTYDPKLLWPADEWDGWMSPSPLKTLYVGAAGVVWGLDRLREHGHAETQLDLARVAREVLEAWHEKPGVLTVLDLPQPARASLFMGETGILAVLWRLDPSDQVADDLYARIRENVANPGNDVMWGSPGTLLAALAMFRWTSDERWADAWRESARTLLRDRDGEGLWTQRLHGGVYRGLGPVHGVVGNVLALLQGDQLLDEGLPAAFRVETAELLARTAVVEDGLANWPMAEGQDLVGADGQIRVQWDCGAPGIVASAASYLDEELLLAGAELTWRAGPHGAEKGPCLCHGTAGSGYAFLKVFERTQDERWLTRARSYAAHALDQVRHARTRRGHGRYSLWTGDVGVALYAADCIEGRGAFPIIDTWD